MNIRRKWLDGEHTIGPGTILTIRDDNLPSMQWRFGRVIEVQPGPDVITRVVRLRTSTGKMTGNVKKFVPLFIESDQCAE